MTTSIPMMEGDVKNIINILVGIASAAVFITLVIVVSKMVKAIWGGM